MKSKDEHKKSVTPRFNVLDMRRCVRLLLQPRFQACHTCHPFVKSADADTRHCGPATVACETSCNWQVALAAWLICQRLLQQGRLSVKSVHSSSFCTPAVAFCCCCCRTAWTSFSRLRNAVSRVAVPARGALPHPITTASSVCPVIALEVSIRPPHTPQRLRRA